MNERPSVLFVTVDGESCAECGNPIPKDDAVIVWNDNVYDTLACYQEGWTRIEDSGLDHIAARDQAVAAVKDALASEPSQFLFVFEPEEDSITTTVFSTPDFVMQAVAALVEGVAIHEPTVNPPPGREDPDE